MKICVIGNSHVACLKNGWEKLKVSYPGLELAFYASRQNRMRNLRVEEGKLTPTNKELKSDLIYTSANERGEIEVESYDAFFVYGLSLSFPKELGEFYYSSSFKDQVFEDLVEKSLAFRVVKKLKEAGAKNIYASHQPIKAQSGDECLVSEAPFCYESDFGVLSEKMKPYGVVGIPQPGTTLSQNCRTLQKFSSGSVRLDVGDDISNDFHSPKDLSHMNGDFGALVLENLFRVIF